jgi:hypothetical protein
MQLIPNKNPIIVIKRIYKPLLSLNLLHYIQKTPIVQKIPR